jgi:hypothetical protein
MLVFIHINKTAGRTVRYMLRSSFGVRHCEVETRRVNGEKQPFSSADLRQLRKLYPRLESIAGHSVTGNINLEEHGTRFDYFTFVREPLKTCASRFQYNVQYRGHKDLVFEEWIERDWTRNNQTRMISGTTDANDAIRMIKEKQIFVGLTEHFDESILMLKRLLANDLDISYKRVNVAQDNKLAQALLTNERTRQLLIEANQADLELYRYIIEELYPAYRREYGPTLKADVADYKRTRRNSFNYWNLTLSRLKQYVVYKMALSLTSDRVAGERLAS